MTLGTSFHFHIVHLLMTAGALGMHGITQGRLRVFGQVAMTLIACARFSLDVRPMMTVGTTCRILFGVILVAVGKLAHFGMMATHAGFLRKLLMVGRKFGVKFRRVAGSARQHGSIGHRTASKLRLFFVVTFCAVPPHTLVFHMSRMGKNHIAAFIVQSKTNRQLFRRCRCELAAQGQERQYATDDGNGYVTFFQGSVLVLRFDTTQEKMLKSSIHPRHDTRS